MVKYSTRTLYQASVLRGLSGLQMRFGQPHQQLSLALCELFTFTRKHGRNGVNSRGADGQSEEREEGREVQTDAGKRRKERNTWRREGKGGRDKKEK